jgi:hypothetical protein
LCGTGADVSCFMPCLMDKPLLWIRPYTWGLMSVDGVLKYYCETESSVCSHVCNEPAELSHWDDYT